MIRIGRTLVILQVARDTSRSAQVVIVVDVAVSALPRRYRVAARKGESDGRMIELGSEPVLHAVAFFAGDRELASNVIRDAGLAVILGVAGVTLS